jgi:ATP-dependent Clp protease ATP-binding subunit ClpC
VTQDISLLGAGAKSLSEFEARFRTIIEELRSSQDCIIFIDEVYTLVAFAQSVYGVAEVVDAAPRRVPALAHGRFSASGRLPLTNIASIMRKIWRCNLTSKR